MSAGTASSAAGRATRICLNIVSHSHTAITSMTCGPIATPARTASSGTEANPQTECWTESAAPPATRSSRSAQRSARVHQRAFLVTTRERIVIAVSVSAIAGYSGAQRSPIPPATASSRSTS